MAETSIEADALAFVEFIETLPEHDEMRRFLAAWREYRSYRGEKGDGTDPFEFTREAS